MSKISVWGYREWFTWLTIKTHVSETARMNKESRWYLKICHNYMLGQLKRGSYPQWQRKNTVWYHRLALQNSVLVFTKLTFNWQWDSGENALQWFNTKARKWAPKEPQLQRRIGNTAQGQIKGLSPMLCLWRWHQRRDYGKGEWPAPCCWL